MKYPLLAFYTLIILLASCTNASENQDLPDKITGLKVGLRVKNSPSEVYAIENKNDPRNRGDYLWKYSTTVETINEELEIIEFGGFTKTANGWEERSYGGKPFTNEQFAEWYTCPNGILKKGESYTDGNNWNTSDSLGTVTETSLLYYIAEDKKGKRYVGYGEVKIIPQIKK